MGNTRANPIDEDLIRSLFDYQDGCLVWAVNKGRAKVGQKACVNSTGYKTFKVCGKQYLEHRLIWAWHKMPHAENLDHINGNYLDNRIENLRPATHSENMRNSKLRTDNNSGVKGVYWCKIRNLWKVQIWANGKQQYIGKFKELKDAAAAAIDFRLKNHKNFANLGA